MAVVQQYLYVLFHFYFVPKSDPFFIIANSNTNEKEEESQWKMQILTLKLLNVQFGLRKDVIAVNNGATVNKKPSKMKKHRRSP